MNKKILYLGDTNLQGAAAYLAGLMHSWGWGFDYLASDETLGPGRLETDYGLFILSDYPAAMLDAEDQKAILHKVSGGAGLLMIGGWESFHGLGGDWDRSEIAQALPVEISANDDRRNCDQPVLVRRTDPHPITNNLPWEEHPPVIGGFNQVKAKPDSETLLEACLFHAKSGSDGFSFQMSETQPLLVTGEDRQGRTACLMTDVAPHWVGPLVDWGRPRVTAKAPGAEAIEVGRHYAQFFRQLLEWTAGSA